MTETTTIKVPMPSELRAQLTGLAARQDRSVAAVVRTLVREALAKEPPPLVEKRPVGRPANKPAPGEEPWRDDPDLRLARFKRYIMSFPPGQRAGIVSVPDDWEDTEA